MTVPTLRLHSWPHIGHTWPLTAHQPTSPLPQKTSSEAMNLDVTTEDTPWTYALQCVDRTCPLGPNSKVNEKKKPQVKGLTWGSPWSRLRDSNPRPTHYETTGVRDG
jgi:hypothetical protein